MDEADARVALLSVHAKRLSNRSLLSSSEFARMMRQVCQWIAAIATHISELSADRLRWYCKSDVHRKPTIIREDSFHVTDLGTQLKPLIQNWMTNPDLRKCGECGITAEAK